MLSAKTTSIFSSRYMPISMPFNMQPRNVCAAVFTMFLIGLLFFVRVMVFHVSCQSSTSMRTFAMNDSIMYVWNFPYFVFRVIFMLFGSVL